MFHLWFRPGRPALDARPGLLRNPLPVRARVPRVASAGFGLARWPTGLPRGPRAWADGGIRYPFAPGCPGLRRLASGWLVGLPAGLGLAGPPRNARGKPV